MEKENQVVEWKESWRDEYLKWICGFANAQGGLLVIGKSNRGTITGVADARKLLEDIPNKVRDVLGVIVDVNLRTQRGKEYLEIEVEPYPVSYKGQYHFRSGSTKQELKGAALDKFLLRKQGKHWDAVPVPKVSVEDLDAAAFKCFRGLAERSGRMDEATFKYETSGLMVEFRSKPSPEGSVGTSVEAGERVSGKGSEKTREKTRGRTREKTREKILVAIQADPHVTTAELARIMGLTAKGVEWNLKKLKAERRLRRIGPARGGRWEVMGDGK